METEGLPGAKESLERQVLEREGRHSADVASYQDSTGQLESDLRNTKSVRWPATFGNTRIRSQSKWLLVLR